MALDLRAAAWALRSGVYIQAVGNAPAWANTHIAALACQRGVTRRVRGGIAARS